MLLVKGNSKLGKRIWQFSIPAGDTCPGKSDLCNDRCYAQKGFFVMPSAKASFKAKLEATKRADFALAMTAEIAKRRAEIMRIHVAGDFYSPEYAEKWYEIVKASPATVFFNYTRSWRIDEIRPILEKLGSLPNMRMWWSVDQETGMPTKVPKRIRTAYMAISVIDDPPKKADLAFRDYPVRDLIQKRMNGVLVCPPENGVNTGMTCEQCGNCWRRTPEEAYNSKRIALKLLK